MSLVFQRECPCLPRGRSRTKMHTVSPPRRGHARTGLGSLGTRGQRREQRAGAPAVPAQRATVRPGDQQGQEPAPTRPAGAFGSHERERVGTDTGDGALADRGSTRHDALPSPSPALTHPPFSRARLHSPGSPRKLFPKRAETPPPPAPPEQDRHHSRGDAAGWARALLRGLRGPAGPGRGSQGEEPAGEKEVCGERKRQDLRPLVTASDDRPTVPGKQKGHDSRFQPVCSLPSESKEVRMNNFQKTEHTTNTPTAGAFLRRQGTRRTTQAGVRSSLCSSEPPAPH